VRQWSTLVTATGGVVSCVTIFQVFITLDQGIEYEQNLMGRRIAIVLMRARSSRLVDLVPHVAEILEKLGSIEPGQLVQIP